MSPLLWWIYKRPNTKAGIKSIQCTATSKSIRRLKMCVIRNKQLFLYCLLYGNTDWEIWLKEVRLLIIIWKAVGSNPGWHTGWTQKHSLISSSYKIKTYWNIFNNMGLQIHELNKCLIFPPAARRQWNARWRSLHSNAAGACWNFIKQRLFWLCSVLSNTNLMWIRLLRSPFWSGTGISLKEVASVIRERDIQADRRTRSSCQLGHAGYAAESLVRVRLSHRCLPSNKRGAHWVCVVPHETVWVYATVATNFVRIFQ